jgi:hypothetical protein
MQAINRTLSFCLPITLLAWRSNKKGGSLFASYHIFFLPSFSSVCDAAAASSVLVAVASSRLATSSLNVVYWQGLMGGLLWFYDKCKFRSCSM